MATIDIQKLLYVAVYNNDLDTVVNLVSNGATITQDLILFSRRLGFLNVAGYLRSFNYVPNKIIKKPRKITKIKEQILIHPDYELTLTDEEKSDIEIPLLVDHEYIKNYNKIFLYIVWDYLYLGKLVVPTDCKDIKTTIQNKFYINRTS